MVYEDASDEQFIEWCDYLYIRTPQGLLALLSAKG